jgi:hypothetical protein
MRSAEHVALVEEMRNGYTILVGNPEGKRPFRRHKCKLEASWKEEGRVWIGFSWLRIGTDGDSREDDYEHSGHIKGVEFLD